MISLIMQQRFDVNVASRGYVPATKKMCLERLMIHAWHNFAPTDKQVIHTNDFKYSKYAD